MTASYETGGEILTVGSTVIVFDGNTKRELAITSIGPKRVFIESAYGHRPVPYSKETRVSQQGAYHSYFRTKTEVAEEQRRNVAKARLRDLGIEARLAGGGQDGLSPYPTDLLIQIADLLEDSKLNLAPAKAS
jgi:hypothetical protein